MFVSGCFFMVLVSVICIIFALQRKYDEKYSGNSDSGV